MADKTKTSTLLTRAGNNPADFDGVVNTPVHRASTLVFKTYGDFQAALKAKTYYARAGTPTSAAFEGAIAALEGAAGSITAPSGLSAVTTALLAFARAGDHVLLPDNLYGPARAFAAGTLTAMGVAVEHYPPLIDGEGLGRLLRPATRALLIEAPGSLTFETPDISGLVAAAKARGVVTLMDNSWGTPLLFQPLKHGIDVSIMSATKYIAGHSDLLLGVASGTAETYPALKKAALELGVCAGSEELYLGLRGLRTLEVRLREHERRGRAVAEELAAHPAVKRVLHPALPSCPGHANWKKHFSGASGTFGIVLHENDPARVARMLDGLKFFGIGASWGGYESLCFPAQPGPDRTAQAWTETGFSLRLHIGFEDIDDLKADLDAGLKRLSAAG